MSLVNTRERQLAKLRADREQDIEAERDIISRGVSCGVFVEGMEALFEAPGRFPGWHSAIEQLIDLVSARREMGELLAVVGFRVSEEAVLCADLLGDVPEPVLGLISDSLRRLTARTCRMCGDERGVQHLSEEWGLCDVCVTVELMMSTDPEAAKARGRAPHI
jgi:hypothetical protein